MTGAAAVEFALVFPVVFLMLYGLISFGAVLYTQLAVSRAVNDGALAANSLALCALEAVEAECDFQSRVQSEVRESLANSAVVPLGSNQNILSRLNWLEANVQVNVGQGECANSEGTCASIELIFPYTSESGTRLLPAINIPGIGGTDSWLPEALASTAVTRL